MMVVFNINFCFLLLSIEAFLPTYADFENSQYAINKFSLEFHREASKWEGDENLIVSPLSAQVLLGLLSTAAKGSTQEEILNAIHTNNTDTTKSIFKNLMSALTSTTGDILNIFNKIYVKDGEAFQLSPDFKSIAENTFYSSVENINFSEKEEAAKIINNWVKNVTNKKIDNLISSDSLGENIRAVLINAIYFQGIWKNPFNEHRTWKIPFHINDAEKINVDMMYQQGTFLNQFSNELDAHFVSVPYESSESSLIVILPNQKNGLSTLEDKIVNVNINDILNGMWKYNTKLRIPKFSIKTRLDLKGVFSELGIDSIFNSNAELSGILKSGERLVVSKATQKAFIEVDEKGTKAAAATAIEVVPLSFSCEPHLSFIANHPFLFLIINKGNIIFTGKYVGK